ncbi:hypothetical protein NEOLEDRAFT_1183489 [Neolentinus lepideus HHB14362 ss-1]|uniref:Uncharacterized protein n=1 Tax=Neolentinus lepideus HHB14362 ss-1 TaxID=1314782 RepID=A0A165N8Y1_9AGAM|nr:hypothetical protein NEOLEDRAFT_1183489 [Neolentinus lepideus HHB14362 ss-1]
MQSTAAVSSNLNANVAPTTSSSSESDDILDTPHGFTCDANNYETVHALETALRAELYDALTFGGKRFVDAFISSNDIPDMPSDSSIDAFINRYEGYDTEESQGGRRCLSVQS